MFRNYLTIAYRNFFKNKVFSFINISGLSLGIACSILITLYIKTELSFDRYHTNADRIYRVTVNLILGGQHNFIPSTNYPPGPTMRDDFPEVLEAVRFRPLGKIPVKFNDKHFYEERVFYAEKTLFDVFSFELVIGDPKEALAVGYTTVMSETMAQKYFGDENPIGKKIELNLKEYTVTGVMKDVPHNSHFVFDILVSLETLNVDRPGTLELWRSPFGNYNYILLAAGVDPKELEKKFPEFVKKYYGDDLDGSTFGVEYYLQPLTDIHLHSHMRHEITANSDILYVYIFAVVAAFILFIACVNFMNLTTAHSAQRAKEIGLRKVLGAEKKKLLLQFFGESLFFSFFALLLAIVLVKISLPFITTLSDRALSLESLSIMELVPGLIGIVFIVGILAGSYPAFYLSSFLPVNVLKGTLSGNSNSNFRKILVVSQFAISIALIIGTGLIINQLDFMKNKKLGFDNEQVVIVPVLDRSLSNSLESFKNELKLNSNIISISGASHYPGQRRSGGSYEAEGFEEGESIFMNAMYFDHDYLATLDIDVIAGRNFSLDYPKDQTESIMVNETAVKQIGWDDPIGKTIGYPGADGGFTVVGVVKDFHYKSADYVIEPLFLSNNPNVLRNVMVKIRPENIAGTLEYIGEKWSDFDSGRPFEYFFLDESFNAQYRAQDKMQEVFSYFTVFALFIACLGLYGLASFSAEQRVKEIGIRKTLGASVGEVFKLMAKDFMKLVLIANLVSWPVAWFLADKWMRNFAYRVEMNYTIFVVSSAVALIIALATVSYQSIKAANLNPVIALRDE